MLLFHSKQRCTDDQTELAASTEKVQLPGKKVENSNTAADAAHTECEYEQNPK